MKNYIIQLQDERTKSFYSETISAVDFAAAFAIASRNWNSGSLRIRSISETL